MTKVEMRHMIRGSRIRGKDGMAQGGDWMPGERHIMGSFNFRRIYMGEIGGMYVGLGISAGHWYWVFLAWGWRCGDGC